MSEITALTKDARIVVYNVISIPIHLNHTFVHHAWMDITFAVVTVKIALETVPNVLIHFIVSNAQQAIISHLMVYVWIVVMGVTPVIPGGLVLSAMMATI